MNTDEENVHRAGRPGTHVFYTYVGYSLAQGIFLIFTPELMFTKNEEDPPCRNITYIGIKGMGARLSLPVCANLKWLWLCRWPNWQNIFLKMRCRLDTVEQSIIKVLLNVKMAISAIIQNLK